MTRIQRARAFLESLVMIAFCILLVIEPDLGSQLIIIVAGFALLLEGAQSLVYYATMARKMVGGKLQLYKGIILMDLGAFMLTQDDLPTVYIMVYLMIANLVAGVIDVMHAMESKRLEAGSWRLNMAIGVTNILIAIVCVFFIKSTQMLVYAYSFGLFYSACLRFASAFRRSAIVYIQ